MDRFNQLIGDSERRGLKLILILLLFAMGCTNSRPTVQIAGNTDRGFYRNHTESQLIRDEIKEVFDSVVRIQNNVIYRTYQFYTDEMVKSEIQGQDLREISVESYLDDQSTAGTAIVISDTRGKYALLTASHTVFYPDTIWHYSENNSDSGDPYVEAVSIKQTVNYYVILDRGIIKLELALNDSNRDLAIMTNSIPDENNLMTALELPLGNSERLDWGDMIYAFGYPKGAKMITMGIVSRSDHPIRSILIDASFNRGFSGGAIFAVRNDGSGLEWMGVVTSALGENETYLVPEGVEEREFNPESPYTGDLYVRSTPRINYGITNAVAIKEIMEFFRENAERINELGMVLP